MNTFIQLTVDALALGSVYALIALGYTLVYGVLKLLNFAHGDVFMVGSFIGFGVLNVSAVRRIRRCLSGCFTLVTLAAMAGAPSSASRSSDSPTGRSATRRESHR